MCLCWLVAPCVLGRGCKYVTSYVVLDAALTTFGESCTGVEGRRPPKALLKLRYRYSNEDLRAPLGTHRDAVWDILLHRRGHYVLVGSVNPRQTTTAARRPTGTRLDSCMDTGNCVPANRCAGTAPTFVSITSPCCSHQGDEGQMGRHCPTGTFGHDTHLQALAALTYLAHMASVVSAVRMGPLMAMPAVS